MKIYILFAITFFRFICVYSQDIKLNLLDISYNSFVYENDGNLWISSQGGWNRYNGTESYPYLVNDSISGIKGEWIQSGFWEDSHARHWTCTYDHLCYYTKINDNFTCLELEFNGHKIKQEVRLIGLDSKSEFPILRIENSLCSYNPNTNLLCPLEGNNKTIVPLYNDFLNQKNLLIGYGGIQNNNIELWKNNYNLWNSDIYNFKDCGNLKNVFISDATLYKNEIFLATSQGLMIFNGENHCLSKLVRYQGEDFKAYSIIQKNEFIILSTDRFGILIYNVNRKSWSENISDSHITTPLTSRIPIEIYDVGEHLYISFRRSNPQLIEWDQILPIVNLHDPSSKTIRPDNLISSNNYQVLGDKYEKFSIFKNNQIYSHLNIKNTGAIKNLYIFNGQLFFHDESTIWKYDLSNKQIHTIYQNQSKSLQEVYYYKNKLTAIIENKAYNVANGKLNKVLNSSLNHNILAHCQLNDEITIFNKPNEIILLNGIDTFSIPTNSYVFDFCITSEQNKIYIATNKGLEIYDLNTQNIQFLSIDNARVNKIQNYEDNKYILGTSKGIYHFQDKSYSRIPTKEYDIKELMIVDSLIYYISEDGLKSTQLSIDSSFTAYNLKVAKANYEEYTFSKDNIKYTYKHSDPTLSLNVISNNYLANNSGKLELNIEENNFKIKSHPFKDPFILPPLSAGTYTVTISGKDHLLRPFKPLNIKVHIKGPIWEQWWFYFALTGLFSLCIWGYFRYKNKLIRKEQAIKEEINGLKKSALQAQMNPHFIFNCLNSIQNFIMHNDKEKAMEYLGKFAKLIRLNLKASVEEKISLSEEVAILENYLNLEQLRLNNRFEYTISVSDLIDINSVHISPMLIQPFVENAVIHGMKNIRTDGIINLNFESSNNTLLVKVFDNGKSEKIHNQNFPKHKSYGVSITQKRLNHINNTSSNSNLNINYSDEGTFVSLEINL